MINIKKLNKALSFVKNNDFDSAEKIYYELLRESPNDETVLSFWGMFNVKKGLFNKAEKILESAYKLKNLPSTIAGLAFTKFQLKKYDDAIILYEELFRYDKDSEQIFKKIIDSFRALNMYNFAGAYCQKFLNAHPKSRIGLACMTRYYMDIGEYKKAEECCARTMELYPEDSSTWINAGLLQELLYNNEEVAQECYKKAIENNDNQGFYHLAVSLQKIGHFDEAEQCYKKGLEYFPKDLATQASLGTLYLTQRDFEEGYKYFVKREESKEISSLKKRWVGGEKVSAETVLVYSDQGIGDGIMYSRYLPFLKDYFKKVIVYSRKPVTKLLQNSFKDIEFIDTNLSEIEYDISILIADLPYFLGIDFDSIPAKEGYLTVDSEQVKEYRKKYFETPKLKVGLCWKAGSMGIRAAIHRTVNIEYFKPLFELDNVEFYSFQKDDIFDGCNKFPQIINVAESFNDFNDTASALKNLDLIITVDTSIVHLAGALGVKTKLLLPYCPDWRWFNNTDKTEWYSSVELIKQVDRQDWYKEIDVLKNYIKNFK